MAYGQEFELLDWLKHVTFPTERRFADANYARRTYESVVQRLIDAGTTSELLSGRFHLRGVSGEEDPEPVPSSPQRSATMGRYI